MTLQILGITSGLTSTDFIFIIIFLIGIGASIDRLRARVADLEERQQSGIST